MHPGHQESTVAKDPATALAEPFAPSSSLRGLLMLLRLDESSKRGGHRPGVALALTLALPRISVRGRCRLAAPAIVQDDDAVGVGMTGDQLKRFGLPDIVQFEHPTSLTR